MATVFDAERPAPSQPTAAAKPKEGEHYGEAPPRACTDDQQLASLNGRQRSSLPKATLSWRMKRKEIGKHITKHTKKTFTNDFRVKVDGYRGRPVKLVLRLCPNGVGRDADNSMTLEVLVTVERRCLKLTEIAQLRMNVKILIGEELVSVKELTQRLVNFTVHDFIPHEIITRTHAKHIDMQFEGYIIYDTASNLNSPHVESIEHPEHDSAGLQYANHNQVAMWPETRLKDYPDSYVIPFNSPISVPDFGDVLLQSLPLYSDVESEIHRSPQHETVNVSVVKGPLGFGFSLGGSPQGPVVKQIMDHPRCAQLREGDIILEVNGEKVLTYTQSDVVQVFRQCAKGFQTNFIVLRDVSQQAESPDVYHTSYHILEIRLMRQISGFGFRIIGGSEEGNQATVGVIVEGGGADLDGRLIVGDEIIRINGVSVMDASHRDVISLMRDAAAQGEVTLGIRRKILVPESEHLPDSPPPPPPQGIRHVILERPTLQTSFGFVLQSSTLHLGCRICRIIPESPAELCNQLYMDDELLAVNGRDVSRMDHAGVVSVIKASGTTIQLTVQQPIGPSLSTSQGHLPTQASEQLQQVAARDGLLIQRHIHEQGSLNMRSYKMLLCGLPRTGKTTAMLRLSNQLQCLDPSDSPIPSTGFDKPQTVELYHKTVKQSVVIAGAEGKAEWKYQDLEQQGQTLYSRILKSSSNNASSPAMTPSSSRSDVDSSSYTELQSSDVLPSQSSTALHEQVVLGEQQAVLTSLVKAHDWDAVRKKLKAIEDMTILHMMDCGGHPECHEILPLLLEGRSLSLIFLNLTHDLDKTYRVVFRGKEGPSSIEYESVFTAREVLQRILCSISSLQCGDHKEKPVALLIGSYLDQSKEEAVVTLNKSVQEALKSFIEKDILFPANIQEGKYIVTLNNMSEDQGDIEELRRVILTIIETRFQPEPIPTAWLLLHLLLRAKYEKEPGWCTVEECVKLARACGIEEEELLEEDGILRYIHKHYGTLLYYPKVDGLSGKVICDPNIILHPFTRTFLFSFACNQGHIQTAKSIRATGEIPHDLMETICVTDSADPIPTSEIVALLKNRYILYETVHTAAGTRSYFMPCLLRPDPSVVKEASDPTTLSSLSPAPLQLVPRSTGYVPLGLFPALVVKMSHTWSLIPRERFRNSIQFRVRQEGKPTRRVEFRQHPCYLELRLHTSSKQVSQATDLSILMSCRQQLWKALSQVSSEYPHMRHIVWQFGFYCPGGLKPGRQPHSAVCMTTEDPVDMECLQEPCCVEEDFQLEDKHKSWFKSVSLTTDTTNPVTADGTSQEHVPDDGSGFGRQQLSQDELVIDGDLVMTKNSIGGGAFGSVFKGRLGNQPCAVKVLHPHVPRLLSSLEPTVQDEALERFVNESKILEKYKHRNVVRHLCTRIDPKFNLPILVMELMDESLTCFLKSKENFLSLHTETSLSLDIASGLRFLHSESIIHRDICSDNVLVLHNNGAPVAKVSDFGMSRILRPDCRSLTTLGHRLAFLPPEAGAIARKDYDFSLDVFSFGVVVIQIVTRASEIISVAVRDDLVKKIEVTHPLHSLIQGCIQDEKEKRPSAKDICHILEIKVEELKTM